MLPLPIKLLKDYTDAVLKDEFKFWTSFYHKSDPE